MRITHAYSWKPRRVNPIAITYFAVISLLACLIIPKQVMADYGYPIEQAFAATVAGTPQALKAPLPEKYPATEHAITVFEDREIPDIFWHQDKFHFTAALQKNKNAPLIFIIAGTGASHHSPKNTTLGKLFYQQGFHIIALSSPTYLNFIVTASESQLPGYLPDDANDLYRAMKLALTELGDKVEPSAFHITGYSLGGIHAAFIAALDKKEQSFNFKKVMMINPPVQLYSSVDRLDKLVDNYIPGGAPNANEFLNGVVNKLSRIYQKTDKVKFSPDFLYKAYQVIDTDKSIKPEDKFRGAAGLIGVSFRISAAAMLFASDVLAKKGYIVPVDQELTSTTSLNHYMRIAHMVPFTRYVDDMLIPHLQGSNPGVSRKTLIHNASLNSIEPFLKSATNIAVVTNEDDIILSPAELNYMKSVFGPRITIYPNGGHLGNMDYKENVEHMLAFFKD